MISLLVSIAVAMGAVTATAVAYWDEIRGAVFRWLERHGYERAAKVFMRVEVFAQRGFRKIKTLVVPEGKTRRRTVEERVVPVSELSPELRAHKTRIYDITEQIG